MNYDHAENIFFLSLPDLGWRPFPGVGIFLRVRSITGGLCQGDQRAHPGFVEGGMTLWGLEQVAEGAQSADNVEG